MSVSVKRLGAEHSYRNGRGTLSQQFRFEGVSAASLMSGLFRAPLLGAASIFGTRPGREGERTETSWRLHDFSPVAGFIFDVELNQKGEQSVVRFSQPGRSVPYLQGEALWTITDSGPWAQLDEQINTPAALEVVSEPLGGPRRSLRRRLFFMIGHRQVMSGAMENLATWLANAS